MLKKGYTTHKKVIQCRKRLFSTNFLLQKMIPIGSKYPQTNTDGQRNTTLKVWDNLDHSLSKSMCRILSSEYILDER